MPNTQDKSSYDKGILAVIKGESGTGKSVNAFSFPTPYLFDFDDKMPSIALKHYPKKEIYWDSFNHIFEVDDKIKELKRDCPYETIIVDSITGLVNLVVSSVGKIKGESAVDILKRVTPKSGTIEMMGMDYYSAEDRFCTYFVEQMKSLWSREGNPKHVILIAHVVTVESSPDLKTKVVTRTRSIVSKGKKFAAWLPTGFDNVWLTGYEQPKIDEINNGIKRFIKTESFSDDSAKCSYNLPETIYVGNGDLYAKILEIVR